MGRWLPNKPFAARLHIFTAVAVLLGLVFAALAAPACGAPRFLPQDSAQNHEDAKDLQRLLREPSVDIGKIRLALKLGADPNQPDRDGILPLGRAVRAQDLTLAKTLLNAGANPNKRNGDYPDILIVAAGNLAMLKLLYEHGGDLHARKPHGSTLLMAAAKSGSLDVCRFLVAHGLSVNVKADDEYTALGAAAEGDHLDVVRFLLHCGADPNDCGSLGPNRFFATDRPLTALEAAASACSTRVLAHLLKAKRIRHRRDAMNRALFLSLGLVYLEGYVARPKLYGMADTVAMLLRHGADVKQRNLKGDTSLLYAIRQIGPEESVHALVYLPVYFVLLRAGADINAQNSAGQTALMIGAKGADRPYGFLLYHGADPNKRDKMGRTALMYNASVREEIEQLGFDRIFAVQLLRRYGANLTLRDNAGKTAYDIAKAAASPTVPADFYDPSLRYGVDTRKW